MEIDTKSQLYKCTRYIYTVDSVFWDFFGRREGFLDALTTSLSALTQQCDPQRGVLILRAFPNRTWKVKPASDVLPILPPEPYVGINHARQQFANPGDWVQFVAVHSDLWLLAMAFYFGARFNRTQKAHLFRKVNALPTLLQEVENYARITASPGVARSPDVGRSPAPAAAVEASSSRVKRPKLEEEETTIDNDEAKAGAPSSRMIDIPVNILCPGTLQAASAQYRPQGKNPVDDVATKREILDGGQRQDAQLSSASYKHLGDPHVAKKDAHRFIIKRNSPKLEEIQEENLQGSINLKVIDKGERKNHQKYSAKQLENLRARARYQACGVCTKLFRAAEGTSKIVCSRCKAAFHPKCIDDAAPLLTVHFREYCCSSCISEWPHLYQDM